MTLLSAVSWLFECLAAYVCVTGLRLDLSLADTIVVFTLGSLAGASPSSRAASASPRRA
jgi:uncharacterized membrane protein YbhN (UPF0104 family)